MNAQRKTVYALRQQLLARPLRAGGRRRDGKPTGRDRADRRSTRDRRTTVAPASRSSLGMFGEPPLQPARRERQARAARRAKELEKVDKLVELETLQHEVYQLWGVKLDLEGAQEAHAASTVYDELVELVPRGPHASSASALLDLIDRIIGAMVEESCPQNKPPEDWDWEGIRAGLQGALRASSSSTSSTSSATPSIAGARALRARRGALPREREKEIGVELVLRVFRHFYLEEIDKAWVEHLTNMEHLRDGIGLRGYGQRDPKHEYKKEGYNLFVNMMAKVSSTVLVKLFEVAARSARKRSPRSRPKPSAATTPSSRPPSRATRATRPTTPCGARRSSRDGATPRRPRRARPRARRPRRSAATTRARAARARSSRSATARCSKRTSRPEEPQPRSVIHRGAMIEVEDLTKDYGTVVAVRDVSFRSARAKSSASSARTAPARAPRCASSRASWARPRAGARSTATTSPRSSLAARQRLGYMPEAAPLYPEMRVREYLRLPRAR